MDWSKVKPSDVKKIHVRFEGDVNRHWDVTLKDGSYMEFYGYESGPHYGVASHPNCDGPLWDDNEQLYTWLGSVVNLKIPHFDPESEVADFDLEFTPRGRVVTNIEVQHSSSTDDGFSMDDATLHPGTYHYPPMK